MKQRLSALFRGFVAPLEKEEGRVKYLPSNNMIDLKEEIAQSTNRVMVTREESQNSGCPKNSQNLYGSNRLSGTTDNHHVE